MIMKENNDKDFLNINIKVFEHPEPLSILIPRDEEEMYRKAGDTMNTIIKEYRKKFQVSSFERILILALFHFVKELTTVQNKIKKT